MARSRAFTAPRKGMVPINPRPKFQPEPTKRKRELTDDEDGDEIIVSKPAAKKHRALPLGEPRKPPTAYSTTRNRDMYSPSPRSSPSFVLSASSPEKKRASISSKKSQKFKASAIKTNKAPGTTTQTRYPPAHVRPPSTSLPKGRPSLQSLASTKSNTSSTGRSSRSTTTKPLPRGRKSTSSDDTDRRYACTQCNSRFKRAEHLKRHVTSRHTNNKPFACEECGKTFARSDNRDQHARTHPGGGVMASVEDYDESDGGVPVNEDADEMSGEENDFTAKEADSVMEANVKEEDSSSNEQTRKHHLDSSSEPRSASTWRSVNRRAPLSPKKHKKFSVNPFSTFR